MEQKFDYRGGPPDERLIGPSELAEWLAVSESSIKRWIKQGPEAGRVPTMLRVNGQIRFRPADVRSWLEGRTVA